MHRMGLALCLAVAGCAGTAPPAASPTPPDVEARLAKLEADNAKYAKALEFLQLVYDQQAAAKAAAPAPDAVFAVPVAEAVAAGQVSGAATAAVTIVKAFDFACPYCAKIDPMLDAVVAAYPGQVRVVYENMVVHPFAMPAHLAGCAAGKQRKYLAFKKVLWEQVFPAYVAARDPSLLDEAHMLAAGATAGLEAERLRKDMASDECKARIAADMAELEKFGVRGTPTLFVNGSIMEPGISEEQLKVVVEDKLRAVAASGVSPSEYYGQVVVGKGEKAFRAQGDAAP
jgi:protein-disulfide isomerase